MNEWPWFHCGCFGEVILQNLSLPFFGASVSGISSLGLKPGSPLIGFTSLSNLFEP